MGLRPLAWWDYGFDSRRGFRNLSTLSDVSSQTEIFELVWSIAQRNPTDCHMFDCVRLPLEKKFLEILSNKSMWRTAIEKHCRAPVGMCISKIIINFLWIKDVKLLIWNLVKHNSHILCENERNEGRCCFVPSKYLIFK